MSKSNPSSKVIFLDLSGVFVLLNSVAITLLIVGFALANRYFLFFGWPCSAGMLVHGGYFFVIHLIDWHFGRAVGKKIWAICGVVAISFIGLSQLILSYTPPATSSLVALALWEIRLPIEVIFAWLGHGMGLWLDPLRYFKAKKASRWHHLGSVLSNGIIGHLITLVAMLCCDSQVHLVIGNSLGFTCVSGASSLFAFIVDPKMKGFGKLSSSIGSRALWVYTFLMLSFSGACVLVNLLVVKHVILFGFPVTAALFVYVLTFVFTDVISELYGHHHTKMVIVAGFVANILLIILVMGASSLEPCELFEEEGVFERSFSFVVAIVTASLVAYLVAQSMDVYLFALLRKRTNGRFLWLRNNLATMISQIVDTFIFVFVAWVIWLWLPSGKGDLTWYIWKSIAQGEFIWKLILAILDTPIVYALITGLRYWLRNEPWIASSHKKT